MGLVHIQIVKVSPEGNKQLFKEFQTDDELVDHIDNGSFLTQDEIDSCWNIEIHTYTNRKDLLYYGI